MKPQFDIPFDEKIGETDVAPERGYDAWLRRKIARGLDETRDRDMLISAEEVWRDLGLER
jgi:hypothetical protein